MIKTRVNVMGTLRALRVDESIFLSSEVISERGLRATASALNNIGSYSVNKTDNGYRVRRTK